MTPVETVRLRHITFQVPLPPRRLSPNGGHGHWTSTRRTDYREMVAETAIVERVNQRWGEPAQRVRVSLVFGTKHTRQQRQLQARDPQDRDYLPVDVPNAVSAFKAGFDGLVDAKFFADDNHHVMSLGSVEICAEHGPWVRVTIEELAGGEE